MQLIINEEYLLKKRDVDILEATMRLAPGHFYWKDVYGVYIGCTSSFLNCVKINLSELKGKTDMDLWPQDADTHKNNDFQVINFEASVEAEESITLANGEIKTFLVAKKPWKNQNNRIIGVIANVTDITEYKNTQRINDASIRIDMDNIDFASYLDSIIDCVPSNLYWKNRYGIYLGCNNFMVQVSGAKSREAIIGKTDDVLWSNNADLLRTNDLEVLEEGNTVTVEECVGEKIYLSTKTPLRDKQNKIIGIVGNSVDITYLKKIEIALREATERAAVANRAKSEFLAIVSHELRSPLTSILGMLHFLTTKKNATEEEQAKYLDVISAAAKHLLSLVNDFLDLSRLERGNIELSLTPVNLKVLIEETIAILISQANSKKLDVILEYNAVVPHMILGDSRALRQIIINLVSNAIKFTDKGSITISVNCIEASKSVAKLQLEVIDTGIGMTSDQLNVIFDQFKQIDSSYSRRYGGAGLGLNITKKLINIMDGSIEVISQPKVGSTFRCTIEFPLQNEAIVPLPWISHQTDVPILIIDDTPRGEILRKQINPSNCYVTSSDKALDTFIAGQHTTAYGIVIIDDNIRSSTPWNLAKALQEFSCSKKPMLVLLTSTASLSLKRQAKQANFFECIIKMAQPSELQNNLTAAWEEWVEKNNLPMPIQYPSKKRILLIDDEPIVQLIHKSFLEDLDCVVETADTGDKALELLAQETYDLIFMDMGLPGISGPSVVGSYLQMECKHAPIIALTGYSSKEDRDGFLDAGVVEVLVKPITPKDIEAVLEKYV